LNFAVIQDGPNQTVQHPDTSAGVEAIMAKDCASCANYIHKNHLEDYLARACGETYSGLCRMKDNPSRGAFIRKVECQVNCRDWLPEDMPLAA
jgi:hypothetical protein